MNTTDDIPKGPQNPMIIKLLESLKTMPEYLTERRKKIEERKRFVRYVWEDACRQAGLIK